MATLHDVLASSVRAERARRHLTQAQLAERLDWPRTSIHDAETGRRKLNLDEIAALCVAFELPLVELIRQGDDEQLRALGLRRGA